MLLYGLHQGSIYVYKNISTEITVKMRSLSVFSGRYHSTWLTYRPTMKSVVPYYHNITPMMHKHQYIAMSGRCVK